jgi:hypothetical protein
MLPFCLDVCPEGKEGRGVVDLEELIGDRFVIA